MHASETDRTADDTVRPIIICVMGIASAGKTTVGQLLAAELGSEFLDADTLHPAANIKKMSEGVPLTDADRAPWLAVIHARMVESFRAGKSLVVACSALKQQYRNTLGTGVPVLWIYLKGSKELVRSRRVARQSHFMKAEMLASQFADLEEPRDAIVVDIGIPPGVAVREIIDGLHRRPRRSTSASKRLSYFAAEPPLY